VREAGVNEKKEKEALPKRRKIIARRQGVTVQKILIFLPFFPAIEARWSSLFLRKSAGYTFQYWPHTGYPDCGCHGFPESLQENVVTVVQIMPRLLPSTSFPLQSPVIDPSFDAVYSIT
jgi:hypothetical protein